MSEPLIVLVPLLVLVVVLAFAFAGCVGDAPAFAAGEERAKQDIQTAAEYQNVILGEQDLVGFWRLNEPDDGHTVAIDSVAKVSTGPPPPAHDGQYKNPLGYTKGEVGPLTAQDPNDKSAQFETAHQGYVEVPYDPLLNPPHAFSVEAWIKPMAAAAGSEVVLGAYELDAAGTVSQGFMLDLQPAKVRITLGTGAAPSELPADLAESLEHGGWRYVVATYDGSELSLYVDGVPAVNPINSAYAANPSMPLRIAAGRDAPAGAPANHFFDGRIGDVALYRAALGGDVVRKHFTDGISPLPGS